MKKKIKFLFLILLLFMILLVCYSRYIEPERLVVKEITVETEMDIEKCRIVFFTDTHFGALYDEKHIERIVEMINGLDADIVIFGGDLFDNYARDKEILDLEYLQEELSGIEAKVGKYAVFGNHDYGGGAIRIYEDFMSNCGFHVLNDKIVLLEELNIEIIGFDDYLLGQTEADFYHIQSEYFREYFHLIAMHEPVTSKFIESSGENFMLSGHTHGGQVSAPYFTKKLLPYGSDQFIKGFYDMQDVSADAFFQMYVSSGIGLTRYPFRFLNVPEIIEINLIRKE
ncbi:MAG: metallophosphoesterase [Lachnospiraceae bacterium]|nr:metallophosphoesterase [Lachnospiraceae bacterium]